MGSPHLSMYAVRPLRLNSSIVRHEFSSFRMKIVSVVIRTPAGAPS